MRGLGEGADAGGLGQAGEALEQHVAAGDQRHEEPVDEIPLTHNHPGDLGANLLKMAAGRIELGGEFRGRSGHKFWGLLPQPSRRRAGKSSFRRSN